MVGLLVVNVIMGLWVLGISHNQAIHNALDFYPSTLVIMYHAGAAAGIALLGALVRRIACVCLVLSCIALTTLPISCQVSAEGYPGGDDGGAFGWTLYVGGSCLLSLVVGVTTGVVGLCLALRPKQEQKAPPPPD
jgi:hypothetical protein